MPGAQDRWDQPAEPSQAPPLPGDGYPPPRDLAHLTDRPGRGTIAELRWRLERLPPGHPSSPYNDDLTRKPPVTRLKDLELPLRGSGRARPALGNDLPVSGQATPAGRNGSGAGAAAAEPVSAAAGASPEGRSSTVSPAAATNGSAADRSAQPVVARDGAWEWNGRRLTAAQSRIAEAALSRCRAAEGRNVFGGYGHSGLTPMMRRVEAQLGRGRLVPDTERHALKPVDRFKERLADLIARHPGKPAEELSHEVHDGIRYSFLFEPEHYAEAAKHVHSMLKCNGFDLEARRNTWPNAESKGISSRWRDPAHDLVFEVQFHTPSSWDVRERARSSIREVRDPATPAAERARLRAAHAQMSAAVPVPPGCAAIADVRREGQ